MFLYSAFEFNGCVFVYTNAIVIGVSMLTRRFIYVQKKKKKKKKKVREKSRDCHNHKPQPFPGTKRKKKQTKPNKRKTNVRKAPRLALSSTREVIAMLKGLKNTRTK